MSDCQVCPTDYQVDPVNVTSELKRHTPRHKNLVRGSEAENYVDNECQFTILNAHP